MNKYEVLYILDAKIDDAAKDALIEKFKLAYEINFKSEGYYVLMNFTANADLPQELERQMRITDEVMRFIVVKK